MAPSRLVYSPTFHEDLEKVGGEEFLKRESWRAAVDAVQRNPLGAGRAVPNSKARMMLIYRHQAMPAVVYYVYNGVETTFIGLVVTTM